MKRYINMALLYAILAMAGGVFYREFTKYNGFTAKTTLSFPQGEPAKRDNGAFCPARRGAR